MKRCRGQHEVEEVEDENEVQRARKGVHWIGGLMGTSCRNRTPRVGQKPAVEL